MKLLTPVIFILNKLSIAFLFLLRVDPNAKDKAMTEEELRTIVDVGKETGVIESEEHEMINNVFDFGDAQAKEVMVPRIDMTFANIDCTYDELIEIFKEDKFTRLPVYKETTDNVIGIINMKDCCFIKTGNISLFRTLCGNHILHMSIKIPQSFLWKCVNLPFPLPSSLMSTVLLPGLSLSKIS